MMLIRVRLCRCREDLSVMGLSPLARSLRADRAVIRLAEPVRGVPEVGRDPVVYPTRAEKMVGLSWGM